MRNPLSVALLVSSDRLAAWKLDALSHLLEHADVELTLVVMDERTADRDRLQTLQRAVALREWAVVGAVRALHKRVRGPLPELERRPLVSIPGVEDAEYVGCIPLTVDGWKHALPENVVERLRETDVAIRFGFGFLTGAALDAPRYGVLSFHHGDLREYRGQPMGFWEYVNGESEAGVTLQRLNETLDGGEIAVIERVDISDAGTWGEVRSRLLSASEPMLTRGVARLRDGRPLDRPETLGTLHTLPRGRPVVTYVVRTLEGLLPTRRRGRGPDPDSGAGEL